MERATLMAILDLARWAPSGDNSQPWTFRLDGDAAIEVVGVDQSDHDVYDFDGRPTLLSLGFLLESIALAASRFGAEIAWTYAAAGPHRHRLHITLQAVQRAPDPLSDCLQTRSVARGRYRSDALSAAQKHSLQTALGDGLELRWLETAAAKRQVAGINARATHIRLSIPEAYAVHRRILDWRPGDSADGVPSGAIGLDPMTLSSMRWVMGKWTRVHFMNRYAGGTLVPQLEMDWLPGMFCGAHFMLFGAAGPLLEAQQLLRAGRAMQRFWLTATALGLVMQPSLAPLCFAWYAQHRRAFTADPALLAKAEALRAELQTITAQLSAPPGAAPVFMGRLGVPRAPLAGPRSVRKDLHRLMQAAPSQR